MLLAFILVVGVLAVWGLIRAGAVIFAEESGVYPDGAKVPKLQAPNACDKKKALIKASVCALVLLGCGILYEWGYNSSTAREQREMKQGAEQCDDVLQAYKAAQILIRQADDGALSFPFIPSPDSLALGNCEFKLTGSVERVQVEGVRERAEYEAYVRYRLEDNAWELLGLEWKPVTE